MSAALLATTYLATPLTDQQIDIIRWVIEGTGHAVAIARAGTGKTFTALQALAHMIGATTIAQFNAAIAAETRQKLLEAEPKADGVRPWSITFNSGGFQALLRQFPKMKMSGTDLAKGQAGYHKWDAIIGRLNIPEKFQEFVGEAMKFAKLRAFGYRLPLSTVKAHAQAHHDVLVTCTNCNTVKRFDCERIAKSHGDRQVASLNLRCAKCSTLNRSSIAAYATDINNIEAWEKIVSDYDLDAKFEDADFGESEHLKRMMIRDAIDWAIKALNLSNLMIPDIIDFDDQIYGPLICQTKMFENDWLIIDEAQDTNPARRYLAMRMLKRNGRSLWIGDPLQAIYRFTGADNDAMDIVIRDFNATVLKLTTTFRVPKIIVEMAKEFAPDYEAAAGNIDGEYSEYKYEDFLKRASTLDADTIILCRNTAPLVKLALRFIRLVIPCRLAGFDVAAELLPLIKRWKVRTIRTLRDRITDYRDRQMVILAAAKKNDKIDALADQVDTVFAVMDTLQPTQTVQELIDQVNKLFAPSQQGEPGKKVINLMTIHRSKGLEEQTVVILGRKELLPSKNATHPEALAQERNLEYVALTRTQRRLIDVTLP